MKGHRDPQTSSSWWQPILDQSLPVSPSVYESQLATFWSSDCPTQKYWVLNWEASFPPRPQLLDPPVASGHRCAVGFPGLCGLDSMTEAGGTGLAWAELQATRYGM